MVIHIRHVVIDKRPMAVNTLLKVTASLVVASLVTASLVVASLAIVVHILVIVEQILLVVILGTFSVLKLKVLKIILYL